MILDKGSTAGAKLARGLELYGDELAIAAVFLQKLTRGVAARRSASRAQGAV